MNREKAQNLLSRSLDGELDAAEQARLDQAMADDPGLRELADQWKAARPALEGAIAGLSEFEIEQDWLRIESRLENRTGTPSRTPFFSNWKQVLAGAAACLAAVFLMRGLPTASPTRAGAPEAVATEAPNEVEYVTTEIEGASPVVFVDEETGWAVVWVMEENGAAPTG